MAVDFIATADGTKIPSLTRTDGANAVEVPESVASFDDGSGSPVRVSTANPMPVVLPAGAATEATTAAIAEGVGAPDDTPATTDTGTFSLLSLLKRGLQSLTTLVSRAPSLAGGRVPVDGSGVTQPVSGPLTDAQLRAAPLHISPSVAPITGSVTDPSGPLQIAADQSIAGYTVQCRHVGDYTRYRAEISGDGVNGWAPVAGIGTDGTLVVAESGVLSCCGNYTIATFPSRGVHFRLYAVQAGGPSSPMEFLVTPVMATAMPTPINATNRLATFVAPYPGYDEFVTPWKYICPGTVAVTTVVNGPTKITQFMASNTAAQVRYLKVWYSSGTVVVGTTPTSWTFALPPNWAGPLYMPPISLGGQQSWQFAVTTGYADTDVGAPGEGEVIANGVRN